MKKYDSVAAKDLKAGQCIVIDGTEVFTVISAHQSSADCCNNFVITYKGDNGKPQEYYTFPNQPHTILL